MLPQPSFRQGPSANCPQQWSTPAAPRGEAEQAGGSGALCALRRLHGVKHHYRKSPASDSSLITCWMRLECFVPLTTVWNALLPAFSSSNVLLCKGQRAWDQCCPPLSAHTSCWSCSPQDTCGEDAGGHLPPPLHRVTAAEQPRHHPGERGSQCGTSYCQLMGVWGWPCAPRFAGLTEGVHLHFEHKFQGSCWCVYILPGQKYPSLPWKCSRNLIGSPAYALGLGWFLLAETLPGSCGCGAGYSSLMFLDFQIPALASSFEIFTETKLPFALKRPSSLGHEFTIACSRKSSFLLASGWFGWVVFRLSQVVIKMDGAPVLASCHLAARPLLPQACFACPPPRLPGQKIRQQKIFRLAKCLSEMSQLLWVD